MADKKNQKSTLTFPMRKENYMLLIGGVLLSLLGFIFMSGGASDDPNVYNPEVFSFRRITLGPVFVIGGYIVVLMSILRKPKGGTKAPENKAEEAEL